MRVFTEEQLTALLAAERRRVIDAVVDEIDAFMDSIRKVDRPAYRRLQLRLVALLAEIIRATGDKTDGGSKEGRQSSEQEVHREGAKHEEREGSERERWAGRDIDSESPGELYADAVGPDRSAEVPIPSVPPVRPSQVKPDDGRGSVMGDDHPLLQ